VDKRGERPVSSRDFAPDRMLGRVCGSLEKMKMLSLPWVMENDDLLPLVAGVEYISGREPGGGCRFTAGRGRPLDIAGSTATASPSHPETC
jgi:hypothetical protein